MPKCTVMLFLDLSAAFDTIDTGKLLEILYDEIGLSGKALEWGQIIPNQSHTKGEDKRQIFRRIEC